VGEKKIPPAIKGGEGDRRRNVTKRLKKLVEGGNYEWGEKN